MNKKLLLGGVALMIAGAGVVAVAQVNVVPQVGVQSGYIGKATYSATWIGLVPGTTATDVMCISGSASKVIKLASIKFSGSSTAVTLPITILRRTALDTTGTAASTTANPANTISKRDVNDATATATLISWTANPTINDTSPTYIDSQQLSLSLTTAATVQVPVYFDWSKDVENLLKPPTIASGATATAICANFNGVSVGSGVLTGSITWTEE
jgi:hypothetical protein